MGEIASTCSQQKVDVVASGDARGEIASETNAELAIEVFCGLTGVCV